jgi:hypothetical protein
VNRPRELALTHYDPAVLCQRSAERETVRHVLDLLRQAASDQSYCVARLRWIEQHDVQAVADTLGMTPGQVWVREHRMKQKFRELYESYTSGQRESDSPPARLKLATT